MCIRAPARRERRRDASARRRDVGFRNGRNGRLVHANAATAAETNANASEIELLRGSETLYRFYDPSTGVSAPFDDMLAAAGLEPLGREVERVPREEREKARK